MFSTLMNFSEHLIETLADFGTQMYDFIFSTVNIDVLGIETSVFALMFGSAFFLWVGAKIIRSIV